MYHVLSGKWTPLFLCVSIAVSAHFFAGCSRGGGSYVAHTPVDAQTGTFIDSPVEGMQYRTPSWSGYTESNGGFYYQEGEKITFYIGGIYFGEVTATSIVTPLTLEGLDILTSEDTTVINMSRILLTLDEDRNPGNGITITRQLCNDLAAVNLDLTNPNLVLENDPEVNKMLGIMTGSDVAAEEQANLLVSSADAQVHLENTINSITAEAEEMQETLENMAPVAIICSPGGNVIMVQGQTLSFQGSAFGGKSPYLFSWTLPDWSSDKQSPGTRTFNTLGDFYLYCNVTDTKGKTGEGFRFISVMDTSTQEGASGDTIPNLSIKYSDDTSIPIKAGDIVYFKATIEKGNLPLIYNWTLGSVPGNSFVDKSEKVEYVSPYTYVITQGIRLNTPGRYSITISAWDTNPGGLYPDTHAASIPVIVED
jgi:hypothetical protein